MPETPDIDAAAYLAALQGRWRQIAFQQDGRDEPPDDYGAPGAVLSIAGNRYQVHTKEGDLILQGGLVVDASSVPAQIIWTEDVGPRDQLSIRCSFEVDAQRFRFVAAAPGIAPPREFRTAPGQHMRSYVRCR